MELAESGTKFGTTFEEDLVPQDLSALTEAHYEVPRLLGAVAPAARRPERNTARAMSQENLEIARRYAEGFGRQTPQEMVDYIDAFWDPDGDYYPVRKFPESRPCHGIEEISRFNAEYRAAWERYELEVKELIPVGDDRVLLRASVSAKGRESGLKLEGDLHHCLWLRNGRFLRVEDHLTLAGALRALGLDGDTLEAAGLRE